jgi:hypothetical protein
MNKFEKFLNEMYIEKLKLKIAFGVFAVIILVVVICKIIVG